MQQMDMDEKIAIIGIGCRYGDGVSGSRGIWDMLKENRDCTGPPPVNRFDNSFFLSPGEKKRGKIYTKAGAYLKQDPLMFDRQFFNMPPEEANHMDPQVRILLEVVWEALEDAGIPASTLRGSNTGVYMGSTAGEYHLFTVYPHSNINQYSNSGVNSCMISNRISYEFDLRGPSLSIDTACSSSLYSVQIACDALRGGICDTAIAGGVSLVLSPTSTIGLCQAGMLSPDGQCKSFDESANGYSRGDGVGSVVLKPLKRAIEDGDRIYAVIRGGALTNDGRTPGIANPSSDAQLDLLYRAYAAANVNPSDIEYVEAHGTGTQVGDKAEANAIGKFMSKHRSHDAPPLFIGSIKSNIGHAEGAAGIAGVIKTALSLYHKEIPGVVHFKRGNPNINFKELNLKVPTSCIPWPANSKLLAGCSSFGFGGANSHIVLEAPPSKQLNIQTYDDKSSAFSESYFMLTLSAKSLNALEQRYIDWTQFLSNTLVSDPAVFLNALYTANLRFHHHVHRATFVAKSRDELLLLLNKRVNGERSDTIIEGKTPEGNSINRTVFVFSGMGTQWWGMARQLMNTQPIFRNVIQLIDELLAKYGAKWSLVHILSDETDKNRINDTEISQTCICSVQIGLVELYKHYGVTPSAIIGHSVGEVAAAYTAGLLTLATAVRIIFKRGQLLQITSGSGTMAAVLHDVDDVQTRLKSTITYIDVAAINSPSQIVLSGKNEYIKEFTSKLNEDGIQTRVLKVNNAFHSRQQEILKEKFYKKTKFLKKAMSSKEQRPLIPMMSTVTNSYLTLQDVNESDYWWSNIRRSVRFKGAVEAILNDGYNSFLEIGAHPVLSPAIKDIVASKPNKPTIYFITHSLKRPRDLSVSTDDILNFNISLAQMYVNGYPVDMGPMFKGYNCEVVSLPLYPWQRVECSAKTATSSEMYLFPDSCHPLLGKSETSTIYSDFPNIHVWKGKIGTDKEPWIADHVIQNSIIFPAAGFIEIAIAAHYELYTAALLVCMTDLHFDRFLFVSEVGTLSETKVERESNATAKFTFCSFNTVDENWTSHSTMNLELCENTLEETMGQTCLSVTDIITRCPHELDKNELYANITDLAFKLEDSFLCLNKAYYSSLVDEALVYLHSTELVTLQSSRFYIHPAFLDGILQGMGSIMRQRYKILSPNAKHEVYVPKSVEKIYLEKDVYPDNVLIHYAFTSEKEDVYSDVYIADTETHKIIGKFEKLRFGNVGSRKEEKTLQLWEEKWVSIDMGRKTFANSGLTLITGDDEELSSQLEITLTSVGLHSKTHTAEGVQSDQFGTDNESLSNVIITVKPGNINNIDTIDKEEMLQQQYQITDMCISQYKLLSSMEGMNPNVWLITRDGCSVTKYDTVDPHQASAYGFGLCVIQENINFKLSIIDIPSSVDTETAADWLSEYIWKMDNDEKIVALRSSVPNSSNNFDVYSLRLCISKCYDFQHKFSSRKWKLDVDQSFRTGRLSLTACRDLEESISTQFTTVNIASFQLLKSTTSETSAEEGQQAVMFCGHSDQSRIVIGICFENELRSTLRYKRDELINITSKLPASRVLNIVSSYFVPFMVVNDLPPEGTTVICTSSNKDKQSLAIAHMALELGHKVVVAVKDLFNENGLHLRSYDSVKFVEGNELSTVLDEQSVGCIIGSENYVCEIIKSEKMKDRLRPFATIQILNSHKQGHRSSNILVPMNARIVMKNYELPLNDGFRQLKPLIDKLLQLFEESPSVHPLQDSIPQTIDLKDVGTQYNIPFNDVTFSVDEDAVPVNYDFVESEIKFSKNESYIVTGGTKGFGLSLVEWLADSGAGCINILSRSEADYETEARLNCLRKSGTTIVHIKTDIADRTDVEAAFAKIKNNSFKPLSGIFHCAAQYDDRLISDITPENWKNVMAAKSWGALLLHQTSMKFNSELKYFVMISSLVQLVGNSGQASYCAANRYLSSLGHYRRSRGLPATVFCPGIIRDVGFASTQERLFEYWERKGMESLTAVDLLNGLSVILLSGVVEIGMSGHFRVHDYISNSNLSGQLNTYTRSGIDGVDSIEMGFSSSKKLDAKEEEIDIKQMNPDDAKLLILQSLCGLISERLSSDISPELSPSLVGVDSLMATELSGMIQRKFSVPFSSVELINANVTIRELSALIYKRIVAKDILGGQENDEKTEGDTSWKAWYIMDEKVTFPDIQLICFPPIGGGPSVYAWWQYKLSKQNIQLIMAQLPGWEGRHLEKPLQTLDEIAQKLTDYLSPRLIPGKFVLFGHSIGGLIAFEVAHLLKDRGLSPAHIIISSWYAPTLGYPNTEELEKAPSILRQMDQNIRKNIRLTDDKAMRLSFLDNELLSKPELMRRLIPCFLVSLNICQKYRNTHNTKLQCGMTVLGAKSDNFVSPTLLDAWYQEIEANHPFKKIVVSGGHMYIMSAKKKVFKEILNALRNAFFV